MSFSRAERVADLISKALSTALITEVEDDRLKTISITAVVLTNDLASAKVYWIPFMESDKRQRKAVERALVRAGSFLRGYVSRAVSLKHTPELKFFYDESIDRGRHLEEMIEEANSEPAVEDPELDSVTSVVTDE